MPASLNPFTSKLDLVSDLSGYLKLDQSSAQTITASPIFNWGTDTRIPFYDASKKLTDISTLTFASSILGSPYITLTNANTDFTNTLGANSHIKMNNTSATGQSVISCVINGAMKSKWRTDYAGNISWIAYPTDASRGHYFFVGGEYPVGTCKIRIGTGGVAIGKSIVSVAPNKILQVYNSVGTESISIPDSGYVGIFNTSPAYPLDVSSGSSGTANGYSYPYATYAYLTTPVVPSSITGYTNYGAFYDNGSGYLYHGSLGIIGNIDYSTGYIYTTYSGMYFQSIYWQYTLPAQDVAHFEGNILIDNSVTVTDGNFNLTKTTDDGATAFKITAPANVVSGTNPFSIYNSVSQKLLTLTSSTGIEATPSVSVNYYGNFREGGTVNYGGDFFFNSLSSTASKSTGGVRALMIDTGTPGSTAYGVLNFITSDKTLSYNVALKTSSLGTVLNAGWGSGPFSAVPEAWLEINRNTQTGSPTYALKLKYNPSNYLTLDIGSTGIVTFDAVGSGANFTFSDSINLPTVQKTGNYTLTTNDHMVECNGTFTITLPTAVGISGRIYHIKNYGSGLITINTTSSQTIDDDISGAIVLEQYDSLMVQSNNANWRVI